MSEVFFFPQNKDFFLFASLYLGEVKLQKLNVLFLENLTKVTASLIRKRLSIPRSMVICGQILPHFEF